MNCFGKLSRLMLLYISSVNTCELKFSVYPPLNSMAYFCMHNSSSVHNSLLALQI
ncbi:hypothetical protein HanRHA438_Chr10g0448151 [Helianthus annuus]|nr:hypothetical protein HanRHA438_Chr10g0448151 [Helianthus annuus]